MTKQPRLRTILFGVLLPLGLLGVLAQQAAAEPPPVSATFEHKDLDYCVKILARQEHLDMIMDPLARHSITCSFKDVSLSRALHTVLLGTGVQYRLVGKVLAVGNPETLESLAPVLDAPLAPGPRVSLDFVQADITFVLKLLSKELGAELRIGPGVTGTVTMRLTNFPAENAARLTIALQNKGYQWVHEGNVVHVSVAQPTR